jgi:hypothetical protein
MKTKKLHNKVMNNLYNPILQNKREIDLQIGDLIVMGYNRTNCGNAYVEMGIYNGGEIDTMDVDLSKTIIIDYAVNDVTKEDAILATEKNSTFECAEWWRTPTDDEKRLYCAIYKNYTLLNDINKVLNSVIEEKYNNDDIIDILTIIKSKLENEEH